MKAKDKAEELLKECAKGKKPGKILFLAYLKRLEELLEERKPCGVASVNAINREAADWIRKVAKEMGYDDNQLAHLRKQLAKAFEKIRQVKTFQ